MQECRNAVFNQKGIKSCNCERPFVSTTNWQTFKISEHIKISYHPISLVTTLQSHVIEIKKLYTKNVFTNPFIEHIKSTEQESILINKRNYKRVKEIIKP